MTSRPEWTLNGEQNWAAFELWILNLLFCSERKVEGRMSTRKLLGIHSSLVSSKVSQMIEFIWRYYHIFLSIWNSSLMRLSCVAAKQQIYSPFTSTSSRVCSRLEQTRARNIKNMIT
ncbi:uncharacterized protein LOC114871704 isoform X1 [Osmia bicornis bicornis]|uniref:uncharacterized protein LOC114871704 isoform X1 n=1 Tax=Osmia bicornis bicornis TaxID=1437191 RepID=UPI0010F8EA0B|nr:uncharacterized protein LOC114871704 isoform X1 [Osmia bicornis bicornis]XP_029033757.1 uncharacterized protein LOC114871704 isoform X1 [Osmia bicornis bicornis]XP_029033758.1 uncharacterized protein LOC114871704 isoform X1 [Osmia bicornis bicornis]